MLLELVDTVYFFEKKQGSSFLITDLAAAFTFSCLSTCRTKKRNPWRELRMVKIHAKILVLLLMMSRPKSQVSPSSGSRMKDAFTMLLHEEKQQLRAEMAILGQIL